MRTTYLFEVKVESEHDEETVKRVLGRLIDAGMALVDELPPDFDDPDAKVAVEMSVHPPIRIMIGSGLT